jgi:hypothetical protein
LAVQLQPLRGSVGQSILFEKPARTALDREGVIERTLVTAAARPPPDTGDGSAPLTPADHARHPPELPRT